MKSVFLLAGILLCTPLTRADTPELSVRVYKPKNVHASLLSLWLDPSNAVGVRKDGLKTGKDVELPEGAKGVFHLAKSGEIVIVGTPASIEKALETIRFLDVPRRQVELEAHWVEVSLDDSRAFSVKWTESQTIPSSPPGWHLGVVSGNYFALLRALQSRARVNVLMTPRTTTFNNMQTPIVASKADAKSLLLITPTINGDDTVTLGIAPPTPAAKGLLAFSNVRDGETLAIAGWPESPFETGKVSKNKVLLLFITPRIVRVPGENPPGN